MDGKTMPSTTETEIRELEEKLRQADIVADPDLLDELVVEGCFFTAQDGGIYTKEHVLQSHRPAGARKFTRFETSGLRIQDFGNAAVVTVRIDLATVNTQAALLFTRFWLKRDGRWQVVGGSAVQLEHSH